MRPVACAALLALLSPAPVRAPEPVRASDPSRTEFFPAEEAIAGKQGIARTVFHGDRIEDVPLEIIGRYRNYAGPGQDVILARLLGETASYTGVAAGMSGSPVYVDGKLLGALAYRMGTFSKEPIAGITPIQEMIRAAEFTAPPRRASALPRESESGGLVPIATPLLLGGFRREVIEAFTPRLRELGLEPAQAGVASARTGAGGPLREGDSIAAVLVSGDLSVAAAGTLTHVAERRLYAFGHPFLQSGTVEIPAARASILWTLSSWLASNKIAEIGESVGTIREDRLTAIVGELGPAPRTIPVSVEVRSGAGPARRYSFQIARARELVPFLVNLTITNALANTLEFSAEATARLEGSIVVAGHAPVRFDDALAGDAASPVAFAAGSRVADLAAKIVDNPFRDAEVEEIAARFEQVPVLRASALERVVLPSNEIPPGAPFEVHVALRSYRGEPGRATATVELPADALPGPAALLVGEARAVDSAMPLVSGESRLSGARDLSTYLDRLREAPHAGRLLIRLVRPARGATIESQALPDLPSSVLSLLASRPGGERPGLLGGRVLWERLLDLPEPVSGLRMVPVKIGRPLPAPAARGEGR